MCCFIVPMVEAVAVSIYRKVNSSSIGRADAPALKRHVPTLEKMLWGGTVMLIIDHIISGELSWRFPFFTALGQTGGWEVMLHEMLAVGVPMAVVVTAVWAVYSVLKGKKSVQYQTK